MDRSCAQEELAAVEAIYGIDGEVVCESDVDDDHSNQLTIRVHPALSQDVKVFARLRIKLPRDYPDSGTPVCEVVASHGLPAANATQLLKALADVSKHKRGQTHICTCAFSVRPVTPTRLC
jgi:hypothetical protein